MEIKGKTVLITGAGTGIGAATAEAFASKGSRVIICYNHSESKAKKVFSKCKKITDAYLIQLDVTNNDSIMNSILQLKKEFGTPDIIINNAGLIRWTSTKKHKLEEIQDMCDVNLSGLMKMTAAYIPEIEKKKEGIIINISSVAGTYMPLTLIPYSATKAGVIAFTTGLAKELPKKIRTYCIMPGLTATNMTKYMGVSPSKVAGVIVNAVEENLGYKSGESIDARKHF